MENMEMIEARQLAVIATSTFYPDWYEGSVMNSADTDKIRGDLALEMIRVATELGYRVVVVDSASSTAFISRLDQARINVTSSTSEKRSPSRRLAFEFASKLRDVRIIAWTEPEKVSFITDCLDLAIESVLKNMADLLVPKRNNKLFKETYPKYMYSSEVDGNKKYNRLLRTSGLLKPDDGDLDMFFGPKVFVNKPEVLKLFMNMHNIEERAKGSNSSLDPEEYSNTVFYPVIEALYKGLKVISIEVPFRYPITQKQNEEYSSVDTINRFIKKRKAQQESVVAEAELLMKILNNSSREN